MNQRPVTAATAHADQLHAQIRDARCCDPFDPCDTCRGKTAEVRAIRRGVVAASVIPAPRSALAVRLAAARA